MQDEKGPLLKLSCLYIFFMPKVNLRQLLHEGLTESWTLKSEHQGNVWFFLGVGGSDDHIQCI